MVGALPGSTPTKDTLKKKIGCEIGECQAYLKIKPLEEKGKKKRVKLVNAKDT